MAIPGIAANAYATTARLGTPGTGLSKTIGDAAEGKTGSFGAMLRDVAQDIAAAGHKSDVQGQALASGKANIVDVVTAVAETETAIASLVSVRDKVIQAYEEIMRMTI
ncbi:flagellar hook-basal body complex protein FliE [Rhodoplanes sp. TEM]|uniref:Flagellar hook-basal body complex protein FliE n=1 Tax=Rhodoplanes tepidamans TaxID=200616 RepID=A0ABT5J7A8_RHOTP|nr:MULTISPECIES: flagellar hook-basal body complex protein FliE [Rhodoplanes]MDC7785517.1 flagellar hook-basal body complex protein FliE [Rhodoplanes tepidamans]MDC7986138.1 flagellar hook-basal body complex protein FliE [Rhodoplanes sp. TEM]MDQ0353313.1 flagellar hook-basal body complex protein FliE [Rhodoplanes tepidamans]